jgi:hypothetical protein
MEGGAPVVRVVVENYYQFDPPTMGAARIAVLESRGLGGPLEMVEEYPSKLEWYGHILETGGLREFQDRRRLTL